MTEVALTSEMEDIRPKRLAVVLFNLGGPDTLEAVQPFLQNLFSDPAIIRAPLPIRALLARYISRKRAPTTKEIYGQMGDKSPILELTRDQAKVLKTQLLQDPLLELEAAEVFVAMRYWNPFAEEVVQEVKSFKPDQVVLLPLYPQFSTTTSRSSLRDWKLHATKSGLTAPTISLCCYPQEASFVASHADLLRKALDQFGLQDPVRVLFSAHGLPKSIVDKGDPYQWQVEATVAAVVKALNRPDLDHSICYQSRVTPQEWIGPSTEDEIERAGKDGKSVVLTPIAFISEHSETLVELDIEYAELAEEKGVRTYVRVPALGVHYKFIDSLASLTRTLVLERQGFAICSNTGERLCPSGFSECPMKQKAEGDN